MLRLCAFVVATLPLVGFCAAAAFQIPSHYSGEAQKLADPTYGPIPGESDLYNYYWGTERPFPGNITDPVLPTEDGPPGEDDHVWQNLLAAEWIIFEYYQHGIERFTDQDFIDIGMPNNTRRRLLEIRNNEAGHLRIFQNMISPTSVKPGPCRYHFSFRTPLAYLAYLTVLEISSMAFLTGLVQQVKADFAKAAITAIAETETRHEILYSTHNLVIPGSCPPENPEYPYPVQHLPALFAASWTESLLPGATVTLNFTEPNNQPVFDAGTQYYAVFFHGVLNVSVPLDTTDFPERPINVTIPPELETKGIIVTLIADKPGAPTKESVVAGPEVILEQPVELGTALVRAKYAS